MRHFSSSQLSAKHLIKLLIHILYCCRRSAVLPGVLLFCSACVRAHKMALMSQRQFWASLLLDTIAFKDMQRSLQHMQFAEQRASAIYKR